MLRNPLLLIAATLLPLLGQPGLTGGPPPLEIRVRTQLIDPADGSGTGAYIDVRNTSARNVRGYVLQILVMDPVEGVALEHRSRAVSTSKVNGVLHFIAPGELSTNGKPVPLPTTFSGSLAVCAASIDMVVFDDGTTWGPAKLSASANLLKRIAQKDGK